MGSRTEPLGIIRSLTSEPPSDGPGHTGRRTDITGAREMTDHKSMLCIGGPRDGQRYAVLHGTGFRVPIAKPVAVDAPQSDYVEVEFADYRAESFHTPQGDVSFWVPAGQTPLETITMLLQSYEDARR